MADYFQVVAPYLKPDLVASKALSHIYKVTQLLSPFSVACLECRLAASQPRVDFLANVYHGTLSIPNKFLSNPVWQDIQSLDRDWSQPTSFLHSSVKNLCLEFDLEADRLASEIYVPCLFLGLAQFVSSDPNKLTKILDCIPSNLLVFAAKANSFQANIRQCFDNLPRKAFVAHLGMMLSRSTHNVRLHIKGIPALQVPNYLKQIGWKGDISKIRLLIESVSKFVDYFTLDLDIGEEIGLQVGLECYLDKQPPHELRWQSFLDYLVSEGLCASEKKNALLAWSGITYKADCPQNWPSNLMMGDTFLASEATSLFYRAIYHIKLVYQPDLPLLAKAYLEFGHQWIEHDLIKGALSQARNHEKT